MHKLSEKVEFPLPELMLEILLCFSLILFAAAATYQKLLIKTTVKGSLKKIF